MKFCGLSHTLEYIAIMSVFNYVTMFYFSTLQLELLLLHKGIKMVIIKIKDTFIKV